VRTSRKAKNEFAKKSDSDVYVTTCECASWHACAGARSVDRAAAPTAGAARAPSHARQRAGVNSLRALKALPGLLLPEGRAVQASKYSQPEGRAA